MILGGSSPEPAENQKNFLGSENFFCNPHGQTSGSLGGVEPAITIRTISALPTAGYWAEGEESRGPHTHIHDGHSRLHKQEPVKNLRAPQHMMLENPA